ncbi:MAG TPA: hypothetical protein VII37_02875 [Candidatus Acidoferrum sp.]
MSSQYCRFVERGTARRRAPLLEQLLARADDWAPVADWRADAFRVIAPQAACMPAVAAAALCADRGVVDAAWVCVATPVHYVAEMTSVRLPADGMLSLTPAGAETLASDFNRVWQGSGIRMTAARSAQLFCIFDRAFEVLTRDPEDVLDRHIEEFLPIGEDSARLRQLISETEMWLFEHEANRVRTELGLPAINGLWFWGGGAPIASLPTVQGWAAGDDLFFSAFSVPRNEEFQCGVVVAGCVPGSDQWHEVESRWLHPAMIKLRARKIQRLQVSAADRCFTLTVRGLRRFWRRRKPWWESFE